MSIFTKDIPVLKNDPDITIGDWTYGPLTVGKLYSGCKLSVGKFCSIASGAQVMFLGRHATEDATTYPFYAFSQYGWNSVQGTLVEGQDVTIGNDVWIATGATIMQGAYIEDGAVIGAYSIVKTRIPAYSIAVGNPARVVKKRFSDEHISKLLEMKWWDWSIQNINKNISLICSPKIDELYEKWIIEIKK